MNNQKKLSLVDQGQIVESFLARSSGNELLNSLEIKQTKLNQLESDTICLIAFSQYKIAKHIPCPFFIVYQPHEKELKELQQLEIAVNCLGFINSELSLFHYPGVYYYFSQQDGLATSNLISTIKNQTDHRSLMMDLNLELNGVLGEVQKELGRIKRIHEKIVPVRQKEIRGLHLYSKYAAGTSVGGDFFDSLQNEKTLVLFLSSTTSYVLSSMVLAKFSELQKTNLEASEIKYFIDKVINEVESQNLAHSKKATLDLLIFRIDLKTLSFTFASYGGTSLVNSKGKSLLTEKINLIEGQGQLERGEKYLMLTSGINKLKKMPEIKNYLISALGEDSLSLLNEIFYILKKDSKDEFLTYDSSVIIIEVGNNAIISL